MLNCVGVIITTNHKTDGIYLPAEDRRHYVAWSESVKEDFDAAYWKSCGGGMTLEEIARRCVPDLARHLGL